MATEQTGDAPVQRPRLNLKPRDPAAAAKLEYERQHAVKKSPFGDAKPREAVIASRVGKTEEEILKEEVKKEKLHLRLNPQQLEEKRAHEAAVKEVEDEISLESDAGKREVLSAELAARQLKLEKLMEGFEKLALETALSGGAPRVSEMRRQQSGPEAVGPAAGAPGARYHPTQQYAGAGAGAGAGGGRGGYSYGAGGPPRTGYQPTRNYGGGGGEAGGYDAGGYEGGYRQGGSGGGGYQQRGGGRAGFGGGGYQPAGGRDDGFGDGFGGQGSGGYGGRYNRPGSGGGGGYGDRSADDAFFDAPSLSAGGSGGYGGGGGGGRGRGRGRGGYSRDYADSGYGNGGGGYGYSSQGGMGIGGEIDFGGQDRF